MIIDHPSSADLPLLRNLWKEAFGDTDEYLDLFFGTAYSPSRCRFIRDNNKAASALYWFDCEFDGKKIAYIYAVATAESHRGQGLCRMLMDDTHTLLKDEGYAGAVLVPSEEALFGFYGRMGYVTCSSVTEFICRAPEQKLPLEQIGRKDYAAMRRKRLPDHSVIQEGENLDFLITQAELYSGSGFIMAAYRNNGTLVCCELLGDCAKAPMIVSALGCREGKFRTPPQGNSSRPFAMYQSFTATSHAEICQPEPMPGYFGLAFD